MTRDLVNNLQAGAGLAPAVRTATALSSAFDTLGFESVIAAFHIGTFGDTQGTSNYIEAELQESADNVTYSAVADADVHVSSPASAISGTATATFFQSKTGAAAGNVAGLYTVGYKGSKRYLKVNVRMTGTHSTGSPYAVAFFADRKGYRPNFGNLT